MLSIAPRLFNRNGFLCRKCQESGDKGLKARIQHLDLVLETARSLMGSNHERLLRRLHELPREIVELSAQLRRLDPAAVW
jgi:hypothetical protein